jgi:photosystem II stability/assembly factor-like uncharacterized protein
MACAGEISAGQTLPLAVLLGETHVHGLAVDRAVPDQLLIATHHGVFVSNIGTGVATQISIRADDFMGFSPHPTQTDTYFASGHPAGGGNLGVIRSSDGGASWESLDPGVGGPVDFHQLDISKSDPNVLYGVYGALQMSRDGGETWRAVAEAPPGLIDLAVSGADADRLYAATEAGLLLSTDAGTSWRDTPLIAEPVSSIATNAGGDVFAFAIGRGLLRGVEPDLQWEPLNHGFGESVLLQLVIDPSDPTRLFAVSQRNELLGSRDGGIGWTTIARP